ncbi:serine/threonine kinase 19 [Clonorchis sinensis]|uniref:Serine/threonine kinase 19 n=1 Tax=Clonorchis sinensis TaxID=79923 RepID=G7YCY6_CLOSI|nr:serine/threonine kinase 19 [Clonorchis sinensis]
MPSLIILICTTTIASAVMWKTHIYAVPAIRPTLVKSQIYTLVNNRTLVDAHLNKLQNAGKIRLLKLEDETDDSLGIMLSEDYTASFKDIGASEEDCKLFGKFCGP